MPPFTLTPEQEQRWREADEKGLLTDAQRPLWEAYQRQKAQPLESTPPSQPDVGPAPVAAPPPMAAPRPFPPGDPRATSPWYQRLLEAYYPATTMFEPMTGLPMQTGAQTPGEVTDVEHSYGQGQRSGARGILEWAPTAALLAFPPATGLGALATAARLARRGGVTFGAQDLAERAANWLDPATKTDAELAALLTAGGEVAGNLLGRGIGKVAGKIGEAWRETRPWGQAHREVLEGLGERTTPGMVSERRWPRWFDVGLHHSPFGGRVSQVYERAQERINEALDAIGMRHPGGQVTRAGEVGRGAVTARATPGSLETTPQLARGAIDTMPGLVENQLKAGYSRLDASYLSHEIPWQFVKRRLPFAPSVEHLLLDPGLAAREGVGQGSIFDSTVQLLKHLEALPDTITLDEALPIQRTVAGLLTEAEELTAGHPTSLLTQSINDRVRPVLGQIQQQVNEQVAPFLVSLESAQRHARTLVETRGIPEAVLRGQQTTGTLASQDADVLAAYDLLRQPNFVTFIQAHGLRSDMLKLGRLPDMPLIGDSPAKQGQAMANLIDGSMRSMGERLRPDLVPAWRAMDAQYKAAAQLYNSPYITGVAGKNLDDMLTTLVQNERPNDLKALRQALGTRPGGGDVLDDVAQMWLTRKIEAAVARGEPTGRLDVRGLLGELNALTRPAERELFPRGLTALRSQLRKVVAMEDAVREVSLGARADPAKLQILKRTVGDAHLWEAVQSDVLHPLLVRGTDPLQGATLLQGLNELAGVKDVLFDPRHYAELVRLAHTSRALQQTAQTGRLSWSPVVRGIEHGVFLSGLTGLGVMTGHYEPLLGYIIATPTLSWVLTQPQLVKLLTRGMATPMSARAAGDITGAIIGQLYATGLAQDVIPVPGGQPPAP